MKLEDCVIEFLLKLRLLIKRDKMSNLMERSLRYTMYRRYCDKLRLRLHPRILLSMLTDCVSMYFLLLS